MMTLPEEQKQWGTGLRAWREAWKFSRLIAADVLGVSRRTLESWENGRQPGAILVRQILRRVRTLRKHVVVKRVKSFKKHVDSIAQRPTLAA